MKILYIFRVRIIHSSRLIHDMNHIAYIIKQLNIVFSNLFNSILFSTYLFDLMSDTVTL